MRLKLKVAEAHVGRDFPAAQGEFSYLGDGFVLISGDVLRGAAGRLGLGPTLAAQESQDHLLCKAFSEGTEPPVGLDQGKLAVEAQGEGESWDVKVLVGAEGALGACAFCLVAHMPGPILLEVRGMIGASAPSWEPPSRGLASGTVGEGG